MSEPVPPPAPAPARTDCWNRIGVAGDRSCPELATVIHCRNCPVFVAGGQELLDRAPPAGYLEQWRQVLAAPPPQEKLKMLSLVIFRLGSEWLALETAIFREATEPRPVHRLPHRKNPILTGMVSIRGELILAINLAALLGTEMDQADQKTAADQSRGKRHAFSRLVVIACQRDTWAFPVDELFGVQRVEQGELQPPPTTLAKAATSFTHAVLSWQERTVGYLNSEAVFAGIRKRVL